MSIRDRIKGFRRVPAASLRPDPRNWRTHPENQRAALRGALEEIGFADAVLVRETPDGLVIVDGHLRAEEAAPDQEVPCLVLDVTEEEAGKLLLSLDPISALATRDEDKLRALVGSIVLDDAALRQLAAGLMSPAAALGGELDESVANGLSLCTCPTCGHEHHRIQA